MIRFLTIFPRCENAQLVKDVGMIPYTLSKECNYISTIASFKNGEYPYLFSEIKGVNQVFIPRFFGYSSLDVLLFILLNYRKYDVLQLYHYSIENVIFGTFFKLLNVFRSNAKTYLKLDADDSIFNIRTKGFKVNLLKMFTSRFNLITAESKTICKFLNEVRLFNRPVVYLPNGFYNRGVREDVAFAKKDNLIITVGRIGSLQKSNEVLFSAFKEFAEMNKDWNLSLIGPIEKSFELYIKFFFEENPQLLSRIDITGPINDREALKSKYDKAKIFVLTSKWEGFPIVFLEAVRSGCTILSTDFSSAKDITDDGKYGGLFKIDDYKKLSNLLVEYTANTKFLKDNCISVQDYAYKYFHWDVICKKLDYLLTND
ncbi:glycosyltransferase [Pedobacter nutrimenti]|uniref:glycosyltransferase n=1 Tax=Pedobacter nutrimenti TaxID=1241337 RepID=UPI0029312F2B|nr:glycosyltransferase [Pedobacter nutrimenti]